MIDGHFREALGNLARAAEAMQPYRDRFVLAGGMVPLLYRHHPRFASASLPPLATTEADVVALPPIMISHVKSVRALLEDAGFVVFEAPGYRGAPGAQYFQDARHGVIHLAPTYVEFLSPLRGNGDSAYVDVAGLHTQSLRYLDLLGHAAMEVDISTVDGANVAGPCIVRVPHPATFIMQKILARSSGRVHGKQAKDLAYIYDVALLTRLFWPELREVLDDVAVANVERAAWAKRARRVLCELFLKEDATPSVEIARILRDAIGTAAPSERAVQTVMAGFVSAVAT